MPVAKGVKKTDAERRAQNKYQAKMYKVVGCKLPKEMAERFIEKATAEKGSVNAALTEMIMQFMESKNL